MPIVRMHNVKLGKCSSNVLNNVINNSNKNVSNRIIIILLSVILRAK